MDLKNIWQQSGGHDNMLNKLLEQHDFDKLISKLPLRKLRRNVLIGILSAAIITLGYVGLFFVAAPWQVYAALVVMISFNVFLIVISWRLYKSIDPVISSSLSLKGELQKNYHSFQSWWSLQQKVSLFVYPIAVTGGFILGGVTGSGKPVEALLYNPKILLVLGIAIVLLVPACYYLSKWMFNHAYGKHLKTLKGLMDELN